MQSDPDAVAVCLVHSYRNPTLERLVGSVLEELPVDTVLSSNVLPRFREFERASSTVVNAGLKPVMTDYIQQLRDLEALPDNHYLMGSDRGALEFDEAVERPALTVLSGPAGGVVGSQDFLKEESVERFISLDMGGTSTDVTAVEGNVPLRDSHRIGGYELAFPMVDVHTVGSGGGSIIWCDEADSLRVGPRSAGADPGPACYGQGGPPTLTDAQLALGRIPRDRPLSDDISLTKDVAEQALGEIGKRLNMSTIQVAKGALTLARTQLVEAVRSITVRNGKKPSGFALFAHGGAGGLFAADVASELGINTIYVPRRAGVASAAGLLSAPQFAQRSVSPLVELQTQSRVPGIDSLLERAPDWASDADSVSFEAECRYSGQTHTISIPFEYSALKAREINGKFRDKYKKQYGYQPEEDGVELVYLNGYWRSEFDDKTLPEKRKSRKSAELSSQEMVTDDGTYRIDVEDLETVSTTQSGPALFSGRTTTVFLPEDWTLEPVDERLVTMTQ
jgi:N-methylhydantoinase A